MIFLKPLGNALSTVMGNVGKGMNKTVVIVLGTDHEGNLITVSGKDGNPVAPAIETTDERTASVAVSHFLDSTGQILLNPYLFDIAKIKGKIVHIYKGDALRSRPSIILH